MFFLLSVNPFNRQLKQQEEINMKTDETLFKELSTRIMESNIIIRDSALQEVHLKIRSIFHYIIPNSLEYPTHFSVSQPQKYPFLIALLRIH